MSPSGTNRKHNGRTTVSKVLDSDPMFVGSNEHHTQVDEACVAGRAKFQKERRLFDYASEVEEESKELADWNRTTASNDDEEGNEEAEFIPFGLDDPSCRWVVGIYNGPTRVGLVRVLNRNACTLTAVVQKYMAPGSVIHADGWKVYNELPRHGFKHHKVIHKGNYVDPYTGAHTQGMERT